jgi:tetratricopeptide (TPR) repeat protein
MLSAILFRTFTLKLKSPGDITTTLSSQLKDLSPEQKEIVSIIDLAVIYGDSYGEKIVPHLERGIALSKKIGYKAGEVICVFNLKFFNLLSSGSATAAGSLSAEEMTGLLEEIKNDSLWYNFGMSLLSYFYWFRGEYDKGFELAFRALKSTETDEQLVNRAWVYYALGVFYFDTKDLVNSEAYYKKAIHCFEKENYLYGIARAKNGLASVFIATRRPKDALPLIEGAANVYKEFDHDAGLSRALNDMAMIEKSLGNYSQCVTIFEECIQLRRRISHLQGLITSLTELGEVYLTESKHDKALAYLKEALELSQTVKSAQKESRVHKLLYEVYKKTGKTESALFHFENFYALANKLLSDEAANNIKRIQSGYEKEKSEKEAEIERLKNVELKSAYEVIEQKNKDILDSIAYARRIQYSLLPTEKYIEQKLKALKN